MNSDHQANQATGHEASQGPTSAPTQDLAEFHWYAAHTNSRHEKLVAQHLEGSQIDYFLPLYKSLRRWKDRRKEVELPLFPGYVFVRIALRHRMQLLKLPGVVQLVSFGGRPAPLPDAEIEALREGLGKRLAVEPHPYLSVGKKVRVRSGALAGMEGILVRRKEKFRVVLSIHLIQRSVAVEVDEAELEPIGN